MEGSPRATVPGERVALHLFHLFHNSQTIDLLERGKSCRLFHCLFQPCSGPCSTNRPRWPIHPPSQIFRQRSNPMTRLGRSPALLRALPWNDNLPRADPKTVCGIDLDPIEVGRFDQAVAAGELVITPDLPCHSPLPEAWARWCREQGCPVLAREVRT